MVPGHYENGTWYPDDPKIRAMLDRQYMLQPPPSKAAQDFIKRALDNPTFRRLMERLKTR